MEAAQPAAEAANETTVLTPEAQPAFAQPAFEQPPRKKKSPLVWLIPVIAVVAAAAVAVAMFLGPLQGWVKKSFGSEEDYRDYVQQNSKDAPADTLSDAYGAVLDSFAGETFVGGAADISMKVSVGDKAITLLEDLTQEELGEKLEMDWAKNIELKLSTNAKDDLQQIGAALNINEKEIAVLDCILNMDKGKLFVAVANLSSEYLEVDLNEYLPAADSESAALTAMLQDPEFVKALPTENELSDLLDKYITIVMDDLDEVEKTTETVKVGQLQQKLTVLKTTITPEDLTDAAEDVLEALYQDQQVERIIRRAVGYLQTQEAFADAVDADEAYNSFKEGIQDALEELKNDASDSAAAESTAVLTEYVNSDHEIVGYAFSAEGEELVRVLEIKSGDKLAFQLEVADTLAIFGEGTQKKGVINAVYTVTTSALTNEELQVLTVSLVDFKAEEDAVNGKIRIAPTSDLLQTMGLSGAASSAIDLAKLQLELGFTSGKNTASVAVNVLSGEELLVGVTFAATEKNAAAITEPATATPADQAEAWLEGLDVEKLLQALKDAGLPVDEVSGLIFGAVAEEDTLPLEQQLSLY